MLDLLVIHPGASHGLVGGHPIYGNLGQNLIAIEPPVWSRILAGYVRDHGFTVQILDAEAEQLNPWEVAAKVNQLKPRLTCLAVYGHQPSASTQQMDGAGAIARRIKIVDSDRVIIMVGGHVSALPERTLRSEFIDFACVGEGPKTVVDLLDGELLPDIPGLVRYFGGDIAKNKPADLLPMHELHGRAWNLLPMGKYQAHNWQCLGGWPRKPYASIHTSLNCPYSCSFCCISAPFGNHVYRMRDPQEVVDEIRMLRDHYGVCTLKIVDEMFVLNQKHYTAIAQGLIDAKLGDELNIWAYSRVDTVKEGHLPLLRRAGFQWLALGIESGSKYVRDGSNKRLKNNDIVKVVRSIQRAGINVIGNFIFGLYDDSFETMQETLDLAQELNCEWANFYSAMAYPGSSLYTEAEAKGWTLPDSWRGYSQHNEDSRPLDTQFVSGADVLRFRDQAFHTYFTSDRYLEMIDKKFGSAAVTEIKEMTRYRLRRKLLEKAA